AQFGRFQVGSTQSGLEEVSSEQVGITQVGTIQVGSNQVGCAQVGIAQVGPAKIGFVQVDQNARLLAAPFVPFLNAFFQKDLDLFFIGHFLHKITDSILIKNWTEHVR